MGKRDRDRWLPESDTRHVSSLQEALSWRLNPRRRRVVPPYGGSDYYAYFTGRDRDEALRVLKRFYDVARRGSEQDGPRAFTFLAGLFTGNPIASIGALWSAIASDKARSEALEESCRSDPDRNLFVMWQLHQDQDGPVVKGGFEDDPDTGRLYAVNRLIDPNFGAG